MSTPHDPAVEAARRVWARDHIGPVLAPAEAMEDAAREALKPIRDLHWKKGPIDGPYCAHDCHDWPCDTARLAYPQEELP